MRMKNPRAFTLMILATTLAVAQEHQMAPGMTHQQHLAQMEKEAELKKRGSVTMGFDQDKTTHHFYLTGGGGVIHVEANDPSDIESRGQIRSHLKTISEEFTRGDFRAPLATHNELPPGAATMPKMKSKITYSYEELPQGAAVRIASSDKVAVKAAHEFVRYQIKEHAPGDLLEVTR